MGLIRLILLGFFAFHFFGFSSVVEAAEEKSDTAKRITRWTADFTHPDSKKKMQITISILDADTNPAMIEFLYSVGEGDEMQTIRTTDVRLFSTLSKDAQGKPAIFGIFLKKPVSPTDPAWSYFSEFPPLLPDYLLLEKESGQIKSKSLTRSTMDEVLISLLTQNAQIGVAEFRPVSPLSTFEVKQADGSSFFTRDFFAKHGIGSAVKDAAVQAIQVQVQKPQEVKDQNMLTKWQAPIWDLITGKQIGEINISVLDADSNPKLAKLSYTLAFFNLATYEYSGLLEKFEIVDLKKGEFRIQFRQTANWYNTRDRMLLDENKRWQAYLPNSLRFNTTSEPNIVLEPIPSEWASQPGQKRTLWAIRSVSLASAYSELTEKNSGKDKRITRWTRDIEDQKTGQKKGEVTIAVLDAETNPVLIEFLYESNGVVRTFFNVEEFLPELKNPGFFEIRLYGYPNYYNGNKVKSTLKADDIPSFVRFSTKYHAVQIETLSDKDSPLKNISSKDAHIEKIAPANYKRSHKSDAHYVMEPFSKNDLRLYTSYFEKKGIEFPHFFKLVSADKTTANSAGKPAVQAPSLNDKRITRWQVSGINPTSGKPTDIYISVFDADTNPVLIEFTYSSAGIDDRTFNDIFKFEVLPDKPGQFQILMEERKAYYDGDKVSKSYFHNFAEVPKSFLFSTKSNTVILETISDKNGPKIITELRAAFFHLTPKDFSKKTYDTAAYKVLEPSTIHNLSYDDFFKPKGIEFPLIKNGGRISVSQKSSAFSSQPTFLSQINSADDLQLGSLLQDKKTEVWQLLQSKDKPTIAEFLKAIGIKPDKSQQNPFQNHKNYYLLEGLESYLPNAIAQFEKAFPGATWYGLGRDIYLFSDAMDAYYTYIGQPGRVKRLHASQPSFNEENPDEVIDFLKTNGFDFTGINQDSTPQIIFDVTSYSKRSKTDLKQNRLSQSSQLMNAAYLEWQKLGRNPFDLLPKVNFVSVSPGANNYMIQTDFDIENFFKNMDFDPPAPKRILQVNGPKSLQYATSWHSVYERFQRTSDNRVVAPFQNPSHIQDRIRMLAELWDVAAVVMNDEFVKETDCHFRRYGVAKTKKTKASSTKQKNSSMNCDDVLDQK